MKLLPFFRRKRIVLCTMVLVLLGGGLSACNLSSLTLVNSTFLGGNLFQFDLLMCSPGGCDGTFLGSCTGASMNDNTGNWAIGIDPSASIVGFTGSLTSPQSGATYNGALTTSSFLEYTNTSSWWTYQDVNTIPTQLFCVNLSITTNGLPADICVYGLEGADNLLGGVSCPQVAGVTCIALGPLAVDLVDFRAELEGEQVNLNWTTASETNHAAFYVEHSPGGQHYQRLERIQGQGNSQVAQHYSQVHYEPVSGMNRYRLASVDQNGQVQYSNEIDVWYTPGTFSLERVYPTPSQGEVHLEFIVPDGGEYELQVFDVQGRRVHSQQMTAQAGRNTFDLDLSAWGSGIYPAVISGNGQKASTRLYRQ